jgi:ribosomal protein S6--L-glutamate ligase
MRVAVLHQDLEWGERSIVELLGQRGHTAILVDVRRSDAGELRDFDLVLNRVYASVANRCFQDNLRTLGLLEDLESFGVPCVNSLRATRFDYDKYLTATTLSSQGVPTPETALVTSMEELEHQRARIAVWGYPLVVKRNMGGRAHDMLRVTSESELTELLRSRLSDEARRDYGAGFVVQPFLQAVGDCDYRIGVVDGEYLYAYSRSLVGLRADERPWIGCIGMGSVFRAYEAPSEERVLACRATEIVGADLNEVDLLITNDGPVVIEVNLTPSYGPEDHDFLVRAIDQILSRRAVARSAGVHD